MEKIRTKIAKIKFDIKFIIQCKRDKLIPTFAKPKIAVSINFRTRWRITLAILDAELQNKYRQKKELSAELVKVEDEFFNNIGYICRLKFNSVVNHTINGKRKGWKKVHDKKIDKLIDRSKKGRNTNEEVNTARIIYNYSAYNLSIEEEKALANGLDTHIPGVINSNHVKAEFEMLYEDIVKQTNHLNNEEKDTLKTKVRRICENYSNIKVPYKYKECINKLYNNKDITIMKTDKGRAVVILDKIMYLNKCNDIIRTDQFQKLNDDPTKKVEGIVQRTLLSMKEKFTKAEYTTIY